MSTQTSDSAVGLDPAAVEEWILALGLGAEPPLHFARAGSGKSNLTWPQPGDAVEGVFPAPRLPGFPSRTELAEIYATETGRDLAALPFWHALGLWKIAIICEGVRRRALEDERNTARTGIPAPQIVDALVRQAQLVAFEVGLGATR